MTPGSTSRQIAAIEAAFAILDNRKTRPKPEQMRMLKADLKAAADALSALAVSR